ncbi:MAG: deoxyguanosinetriphosphate triphosphohydrolase [Fimbriimonadaceae bacterium]|nr:deoxyguanosinetriphosphate triphosphohydrolase [Fimbriimonadaceae bacterium]
MDQIRLMIEAREDQWLSPRAARSSESRGRPVPEPPDPVRTAFQRDRDRILHSKPFRRLKHKTQVFIEPKGDHYRTRLTHSLEVAQVARSIGRALALNEDLIESIALGHDVGHTPFGHAGEQALDEVLRELALPDAPTQFRHYEHSLRVVDILDPLNLSEETRDGIGGHSKGRKDLTAHDGEPTSTLEAAVVRISDRIAYLNHDLDDALRSGLIAGIPSQFLDIGQSHGKRISAMVSDVIRESYDQPAIRLSPGMLSAMNELKEWLFENVYLREPHPAIQVNKAKRVVRDLFLHFLEPGQLPLGFVGPQGAIDYVAGMTDRFAIATYQRVFIPNEFTEILSEIP